MSRRSEPWARVAVVQSWLTPYRLPFYDLLRKELSHRSIELRVVYGQADRAEQAKRLPTTLAWGQYQANRYLRLGARELSWQPCLDLVRDADLVIVEQALKRLLNLVLLARQGRSGPPVAFWGHGKNFQAQRCSAVGETLKRRLSRRAHWWFAYNDLSARAVEALPYPRSRITVVNNAVDTRGLRSARDTVGEEDVSGLAARLRMGSSKNVALFVGGMHEHKRLAFLLQCCDRIRVAIPDFEIVFVGDGPEAGVVEAAARSRAWVHREGPRFGAELAPYFALARVLLIPGMVGLAVLDSFALGVPLVTCDLPYHSPEIDYLEPGVNAVVVGDAHNPESYAGAVVDLLGRPDFRAGMARECRRAASSYTVESMAQRFAGGVESALELS